jgi:hypothetical protein
MFWVDAKRSFAQMVNAESTGRICLVEFKKESFVIQTVEIKVGLKKEYFFKNFYNTVHRKLE